MGQQWMLRDKIHIDDGDEDGGCYDMDGYYTICVNFGGKFVFEFDDEGDNMKRVYFGGRKQFFDFWKLDYTSLLEINKMVAGLGLRGLMYIHWKLHQEDLDKGLRRLNTESDVNEMVSHITEKKCSQINLYVELGKTVIHYGEGSSIELSTNKSKYVTNFEYLEVEDSKENVILLDDFVLPNTANQSNCLPQPNVVGPHDTIPNQFPADMGSGPTQQHSSPPYDIAQTEPTPPINHIPQTEPTPNVEPTDNFTIDLNVQPIEWEFEDLFDLGVNSQLPEFDGFDEQQPNVHDSEPQHVDEPQHQPAAQSVPENQNQLNQIERETTTDGVILETVTEEPEQEEVEVDTQVPDYSLFPDSGYDFIEEGWPEVNIPNLDIPSTQNVQANAAAADIPESDVGEVEEENGESRARAANNGEGTSRARVGPGCRIRIDDVNTDNMDENLAPSDELRSDVGSDDEEITSRDSRIRDFNPETDMRDPSFHVGQRFGSRREAKAAVDRYSVKQRRKLDFFNIDKKRIRVKCIGNDQCPWYMWISKDGKGEDWLVKTYIPTHNCPTFVKHNKANYHYICELYLETFRTIPNLTTPQLQTMVQQQQHLDITYQVAMRARKKALQIIKGDALEQFKQIFSYATEVMRTNPGTTFIIQRDPENNFRRCYVCLAAMKQGFMSGMRKLMGLDGCFLKGAYRGQLISAVGIDANDCIYPFAWGIVESETRESWKWFLERLRDDLRIDADEEYRWTFMSDMSKGLESAMKEVFYNSEHRWCVYHLYNCFKKNYKGKELKDLLWHCARATTESSFKYWVEKMKKVDHRAWEYVRDKGIDHWTRYKFSDEAKCDLLLNNICECFNAFIKDARDKAIVTCLETVRCKIMKRIYMRRDEMVRKSNGMKLCFKIQDKLERIKTNSRLGISSWNGGDKYGIKCFGGEQHVVDLTKKRCSCRKWDLTGIPCIHGVSAIYHHAANGMTTTTPEDWVDSCYHTETFLKTYSHLLQPIRDPTQWPEVDAICLPPPVTIPRGVQRNKRIRGSAEDPPATRITRVGVPNYCSRCGVAGHKVRSCPNEPVQREPRVQRPRGRPVDPNSKRQKSGNAPSLAGIKKPRKIRRDKQPTPNGAEGSSQAMPPPTV